MIDLNGNTVWSDRDITEHTEALIHQVTPVTEEVILNRKVTAASMGAYTLSDAEQAQLAAYQATCLNAQQVGVQMRTDNERLKSVLAYEQALTRLSRYILAVGKPGEPAVQAVDAVPGHFDGSTWIEPVDAIPGKPEVPAIDPLPATVDVTAADGTVSTVPNPAIEQDTSERAVAKSIVDSSSADVIVLAEHRKP